MIALLGKYKIALLVFLLVVAFGWHYTSTLEELGALKTSFKTEQKSHKDTKESFNQFVKETEANFRRQRAIEDKRRQAFQRYEEDLNELQRTFGKHDLEALLDAKPKLLERRINDAAERMLDKLRRVSAFEGELNPGEPNPPSSETSN